MIDVKKDEGVMPLTVCANPDCESPIYTGDRVWKKGKDLFCKGECLLKSFEQRKKETRAATRIHNFQKNTF